jgi:hypothetical protein
VELLCKDTVVDGVDRVLIRGESGLPQRNAFRDMRPPQSLLERGHSARTAMVALRGCVHGEGK